MNPRDDVTMYDVIVVAGSYTGLADGARAGIGAHQSLLFAPLS